MLVYCTFSMCVRVRVRVSDDVPVVNLPPLLSTTTVDQVGCAFLPVNTGPANYVFERQLN